MSCASGSYRISALLALAVILGASCGGAGTSRPEAEAGCLDLREHDFSSHPIVDLAGTWDFVPAIAAGDKTAWEGRRGAEVPGPWPVDAAAAGFDYPFGVGTFRLSVDLPPDHPPLGLRLELVMSSYRLRANGALLDDFLVLDPGAEWELPVNTSKYYLLPPNDGRLELVLEVSNFWDRYNTGPCVAPELGVWDAVQEARLSAVAGETFLAGLLLIAAVYHLMLYFIQRKDRALLYFALLSFGVLLRQLSTNEAYWLYMAGAPLPLFLKLQLGSIWFICIASIFYFEAVFPKAAFRVPFRILTVAAAAGLILNLILPMRQFTALLQLIHLCMGATILYVLAVLVRSMLRREPQAGLMLAATLSLSIPALLDIYKTMGHTLSRYVTPLGLLPFITLQSFLLALRYTRGAVEAEALRLETEQLAAVDAMKTSFLANVSHELRTPLSLILAPLALIREGRYGAELPRDHRVFDLIHTNGLRMLRLVENLLEFSRAGNKRPLDLVPINIPEYCLRLFEELAPLAHRRGIEDLSFELPEHAERYVAMADLRAVETVFLNLLGNAVKFTPPGGSVSVRFSLEGAPGKERLRMAVRDTGCGIKPEDLGGLFIRYRTLYAAGRADYRGNGIGLSLSREEALAMGGDLVAESVYGSGSVFTLLLPISDAEPDPLPDRPASFGGVEAYLPPTEELGRLEGGSQLPAAGADRRPRVLLVEDHEELGALTADSLGRHYRLEWARSGAEAQAALNGPEEIEVVVCDMLLPDMEGKAVLEACGADGRLSSVPFIFVSALADRDAHLETLHSGAVDYIVKPFAMEELLAKVRSHIRIRRLATESFHKKLRAFLEAHEEERDAASAEYPAEMTGREVEVLEMVCAGYRDKEIADALGLSVRTASNHVAAILRKTGLSSRQSLRERFGRS